MNDPIFCHLLEVRVLSGQFDIVSIAKTTSVSEAAVWLMPKRYLYPNHRSCAHKTFLGLGVILIIEDVSDIPVECTSFCGLLMLSKPDYAMSLLRMYYQYSTGVER